MIIFRIVPVEILLYFQTSFALVTYLHNVVNFDIFKDTHFVNGLPTSFVSISINRINYHHHKIKLKV